MIYENVVDIVIFDLLINRNDETKNKWLNFNLR